MANFSLLLGALAYCGSPPVPGALTWTLDPWLVLAWGSLTALHLSHLAAGRPRRLALAGYGIALLAFVSPLCNLGVALFSARVAQHVVLILIAAPLIAAATLPERGRRAPVGVGPLVLACGFFTAFLWAWHMPGPYDATFFSDLVYWAMHLSLFGSATVLWRLLMAGGVRQPAMLVTGLIAGFQMSLLGSILAFADRPFFAVHAATTAPWGLTPLDDQAIGGLIMWVPAGLLSVGVALYALGAHLRRLEAAEPDAPVVPLAPAAYVQNGPMTVGKVSNMATARNSDALISPQ
ncbi:MAG: cytochrome c oxidase assembly protein [Alphaproteobacteria bacterium]|nr:cytochrome c oxidase assembly protein [Alphaproteobacteria bacterium]